jgi:Na+/H+ antiporter NhaC
MGTSLVAITSVRLLLSTLSALLLQGLESEVLSLRKLMKMAISIYVRIIIKRGVFHQAEHPLGQSLVA